MSKSTEPLTKHERDAYELVKPFVSRKHGFEHIYTIARILEEHEALGNRVAELEAVLANLLQTADGVPVTLGMTVWFWGSHAWVRRIYDSGKEGIMVSVADTKGPQGCVPVTQCYSTQSAYVAAFI